MSTDPRKEADRLFRQECRFVAGAQNAAAIPPPELPEVAFIGRSNVGKSSLINALTRRKALARTSSTPGRTQQINFFDLGGQMTLVDLPGYGHAVASKEKITAWNMLIHGYLTERNTLRRVCVLMDSRHAPKDSDFEMMHMLETSGVPYLIVLTKADKKPETAPPDMVATLESQLSACAHGHPRVFATSAEKGQGLDDLRVVLAGLGS